jgi:hypothetical protein
MSVLTWPTLARKLPPQFEWQLISNTQTFTSPLSGSIQTIEMPGARWACAFSLGALDAQDAALMRAFMAKLRGQSGRFYFWNMARPTPRGIATGSPIINGASQTGSTLSTSGWTPSTAGILKAGDFFSVNNELKIVVEDATSNASGVATLTFEPPLRYSPSNGQAITTNKPTTIFKMDEDSARQITTAPLLDAISFAMTEAW